MKTAEIQNNEQKRLMALHSYEVLDSPQETSFDSLTRLAAHLLEAPIVLISLVDSQRVWFKSRYGFNITEISRDTSFCAHIVASDRPLIVADASQESRFADNPWVCGSPAIRFYAGFPLRTPEGFVLGSFCVMDYLPRIANPRELEILETLAATVMPKLELNRQARQLGKEKTRLLTLCNTTSDALFFVNSEGIIDGINLATTKLLGYTQEEMIGHNINSYLAKLRTDTSRAVSSIYGSDTRNSEVLALAKDTTAIPCERSTGTLNYDRQQCCVEILRDLRARKKSVTLLPISEPLLIGDSPVMKKLYATIESVGSGEWTVLIEGETGSGKELVARAIHLVSTRRKGPFIAVNCAGLTESILGSQLFGHAKGAFTGATAVTEGLFEAANGGTLFLDEIGDIAPSVQIALLRVLQEREVTRLGETKPRKVDVRIIAATHRNLSKRVSEGTFREDLFYRIHSARIHVPALRERKEDIPMLISGILAEERVTAGKLISGISQEALNALLQFNWPGNVRELRGAIEFAVVHCHSHRIELGDLPAEILDVPIPQMVTPKMEQDERTQILNMLTRTAGNKARAANLLKMGRSTLYRRMRELCIDFGNSMSCDT